MCLHFYSYNRIIYIVYTHRIGTDVVRHISSTKYVINSLEGTENMKKNKKILIVSLTAALLGGFSYNLLINSNNIKEQNQNKKETIAMYVQDEEGNYQLSGSKEFPKEGYFLNLEKSMCKNGGVLSQSSETLRIDLRVNKADQCNLYFDKVVDKNNLATFLKNVPKKTTSPNFSANATTDETADGLYSMEDDYGTSYYFRGAVENNYVKFGRNASGQDMYWRIIRFNGDGSMRLIYDGTSAHSNGESSTDRLVETDVIWSSTLENKINLAWTVSKPSAASVYATTPTPTPTPTTKVAKSTLDTWYKTNILDTGYTTYISNNIFCNDKVETAKTETITLPAPAGTATVTNYYYGASNNDFKCTQPADAFTAEDGTGKGNELLMYPVGLITKNEVVTAGKGSSGIENNDFYLYKGSTPYWTMSPYSFATHKLGNSGTKTIVSINTAPQNENTFANTKSPINLPAVGLVPVINIKAEHLENFVGEGTMSDPYHLSNE